MRLPALLAPFLFAVLVFAPDARAADGFGPALDPGELDALRGGYQLPGGLAVGFGLERLVAVNGEVVVAQRVDIPDLAAITPDQARQLASLTDGRTIQVGGATTITPGIGTVVIQNALDDQRIQALTGLHVDVNTLGLLQSMNFARSLDDALRLGATP
ncbi:MAG TPA: hypothetical protein VIG88_07880 [Lysobacter sp.]